MTLARALIAIGAALAAGCAGRAEPGSGSWSAASPVADAAAPSSTGAAGDAPSLAAAGTAPTTATEAAVGGRMRLDDCLRVALGRNLSLARARHAEALARAQRGEAIAAFAPRIVAGGRWTDRSNEPAIGFAGQQISMTDRWYDTGHVELRVPLFNAGNAPGALTVAERGVAAAAADRERARLDVALGVESAYLDALSASARLASADGALAAARAQSDAAKDRAARGLGLGTDALAAEVRVAQREQDRLHAGHAASDARARLAWAMGLAPTTPVEPVDELAAPRPAPTAERLIAVARARRPDLRAARERVAAAEAAQRVARAGRLPQLSAYGGLEANDDSHLVNHSWWEAGVSGELPLFDAGVAARVAEAQARLAAQRDELAQLDQDAALELTRERLALADAAAAAPVAARAAEVARARLGDVRDQYAQGLADVATALAAEADAADAAARRDESRFAWHAAYARLRHALGGGEVPDDDPPTTQGTP